MKNKLGKRKFELTVVLLILLFIGFMKIVTMTASPVSAEDYSSMPSLFYNDNYYVYSVPGNSTYLPLEIVDGVYYVPVYLFKLLNCEMDSKDNYKDKFYIKYGNNYINFNVSAGRTEGLLDGIFRDNISCEVKFIRGATYVPAAIVSIYLGLNWKYNEQYNVLRIYESGTKRTFEEILEPFIKKLQTNPPPDSAPPVITTVPAVSSLEITTQPPTVNSFATEPTTRRGDNKPIPTTAPPPTTTEEPTTAEETREIDNYLMFYDSYEYASDEPAESGETDKTDKTDKLDEVLDILAQNEITAVFFLSGREITENPDVLRKIYSSGNELGIKIEAESGEADFDADNLISELENTNALIYSAVKHKTRFCMFNKSNESADILVSYENKLKENGYYLCKNTVGISDLTDISDTKMMLDFMKQETVNVFMFDLNDLSGGYKNYIDLSAQAAETKFYIKISFINNANIENIINQIKDRDMLKTTG